MGTDGEESWRDIIGFEGLYQISNIGRVKSLKRMSYSRYGKYKTVPERILALNKDKNTHYVAITLSLDSKRITRFVHRLVAIAFIENPEDKCCVNHIDGNPSNNNANNLEWVTMSENAQHSYSSDLKRNKTSWSREEIEIKLINTISEAISYPEQFITGICIDKAKVQKYIESNL